MKPIHQPGPVLDPRTSGILNRALDAGHTLPSLMREVRSRSIGGVAAAATKETPPSTAGARSLVISAARQRPRPLTLEPAPSRWSPRRPTVYVLFKPLNEEPINDEGTSPDTA